jgi:hypothetical protein
MWPNDRVTNLFDIELPIIQAPMAGSRFRISVFGHLWLGPHSRLVVRPPYPRLLHRVLLLELFQILTQRVMDLGRFHQPSQ